MARIRRMAASQSRTEAWRRILLVEDSPVQQRLLSMLIAQLGHSVIVASDGFDALCALRRDRNFDAILMDCQMPVMDGFESTRRIRDLEKTTGRHITIIGISTDACREDCLAAGMDDFLPKPVSTLVLHAALERAKPRKTPVTWRRLDLDAQASTG